MTGSFLNLFTRPISEVFPLYGRATPSITPNIPAYYAATILGEKAVDSLAVLHQLRLVGELKFLDILRYIYPLRDSNEKPSNLLSIDAGNLMNANPNEVEATASLGSIIRKFESSRTGVTYIINHANTIVGHITLQDILQVLTSCYDVFDIPAEALASKALVKLSLGSTLGKVMEAMIDRFVRKIFLTENGKIVRILDDRDITNVIFNSVQSQKSYSEIWKMQAKSVAKTPKMESKPSLTKLATTFLRDDLRHVLLDSEGVITRWDLSVKLARIIISGSKTEIANDDKRKKRDERRATKYY